MQAQVIGAPLQECRRNRATHCLADERQVAVIKLVLQCLGARADDGLAGALVPVLMMVLRPLSSAGNR
jgi:hypothetical protein